MKKSRLKKKFSGIFLKNKFNKGNSDMEAKIIPDFPRKKLSEIKDKKNLSITKLHNLTNVNRGVIERFLDGHKINHIDYMKIANTFPEIQEYTDKTILQVAPINFFGTVEQGGYVRGLFLNEQRTFLLDKPLKTIFTSELVALHDSFSANKFVCIYKENKTSFTRHDHNHMYLVKTKTDCWFGLIKEHNSHFCLHDRHKLEPITVKELEIIEVFEMLALINDRWSELKDPKFTSIVSNED